MADMYLGHALNPAHTDLDLLWNSAQTAGANAAIALAAAEAAQVDADAAQVSANAAQATANTALAAALAAGGGLTVFNVKASPYNAVGNGVANDRAAIQAASDACNAAGGGILFFPKGVFLIAGDVTFTRAVMVWGSGAQVSIVKATGTMRYLKLKGPGGWTHTIRDIGTLGVGIKYGETNADFGNGASLVDCEIQGVTGNGVYYGWNCWLTNIDRCQIHDNTINVYVDMAIAGATSGAAMRISRSGLFNMDVGLYVNGGNGLQMYVSETDIEHSSVAAVQTVGVGEMSIFLNQVHFELNTGYHIDNDGAHIFVDGFWALSGTELAWCYSRSGWIYLKNGRGDFALNKFAKMAGGTIQVDQESIFCAARWFGQGMLSLATAGSTGGTIVSTRGTLLGWYNQTITLTNAVPKVDGVSVISGYDRNIRVWDFDVISTIGAATDNKLRIYLNPGGTNLVDIDFIDLVSGVARLRVVWLPGVSLTASGVWVGSTGIPRTFSVTDVDGIAASSDRTMDMETLKAGATAAQLVIQNITESISGPRQTGL